MARRVIRVNSTLVIKMACMNLALSKPMTLAEFLEWEERQELRYEFDGVRPIAMAGGTRVHAAIQRNLTTSLTNPLRGKRCQFFGSNLKTQTADDHSRYPDGIVTCSGGKNTSTIVSDPT
jgi:Uma2 family endonuclease